MGGLAGVGVDSTLPDGPEPGHLKEELWDEAPLVPMSVNMKRFSPPPSPSFLFFHSCTENACHRVRQACTVLPWPLQMLAVGQNARVQFLRLVCFLLLRFHTHAGGASYANWSLGHQGLCPLEMEEVR